MLAPVCSSFSFMSSSRAQRYFFNPEGDTSYDFVKLGNLMANRPASETPHAKRKFSQCYLDLALQGDTVGLPPRKLGALLYH